VPRPWVARPSESSLGGWEVVGPSRCGGEDVMVAAYLSERDARLIARASEVELLPPEETPHAD
jgi:hypothetical protein